VEPDIAAKLEKRSEEEFSITQVSTHVIAKGSRGGCVIKSHSIPVGATTKLIAHLRDLVI